MVRHPYSDMQKESTGRRADAASSIAHLFSILPRLNMPKEKLHEHSEIRRADRRKERARRGSYNDEDQRTADGTNRIGENTLLTAFSPMSFHDFQYTMTYLFRSIITRSSSSSSSSISRSLLLLRLLYISLSPPLPPLYLALSSSSTSRFTSHPTGGSSQLKRCCGG